MRKKNATIWTMIVVCIAYSPAFGCIEFNDGQIHNIDCKIDDCVNVDLDQPGMKTTVNLLSGGEISGSLEGGGNSRLSISDGTIGSSLYAHGRSWVTVSGGSIGVQLNSYGSSHVDMSSGSIGIYLCASDSSQINVSGGSIGNELCAYASSQVSLSGGSIGTTLGAYDSSQVSFSGGLIGRQLLADGLGILTIHGSDFAVDGKVFGYGQLTSILGGSWYDEPCRRLTGKLASGEPINNDFSIGHNARIVLIPEPATVLLLGLGAVMLRRKRK